MKTINQAQAALEAFDVEHWEHDHGLPSIRHTLWHLLTAATRDGLSSGLLIEHALRLASNSCRSGNRLGSFLLDSSRSLPGYHSGWRAEDWLVHTANEIGRAHV